MPSGKPLEGRSCSFIVDSNKSAGISLKGHRTPYINTEQRLCCCFNSINIGQRRLSATDAVRTQYLYPTQPTGRSTP